VTTVSIIITHDKIVLYFFKKFSEIIHKIPGAGDRFDVPGELLNFGWGPDFCREPRSSTEGGKIYFKRIIEPSVIIFIVLQFVANCEFANLFFDFDKLQFSRFQIFSQFITRVSET
jgi:hypothetical protein